MSVDYGTFAKFGLGVTPPATQGFDFVSETLTMDEQVIDANGVRGTRDQSVERFRAGNQVIAGNVVFRPTPVELAALLPWMLGGTPTGSPTVTYPIAETIPTRAVVIDRVSKVYTYAGVGVDGWTIRGRQGQAIEVELRLCAQSETVGNAGTFPALTIDTTTAPFVFSDLAYTFNSLTVVCPEVELSMENMIDKDRFFNSRTLTAITATDRKNKLVSRVPSGDFIALYGAGLAATGVNAGVAGSLVFTNAGSVFTITLPKVTFPKKSPSVPGRGQELFLPLEGIPAKSGASTPSMTMTLAPGP